MTPPDALAETARRFVSDVIAALAVFGGLGIGLVWIGVLFGG